MFTGYTVSRHRAKRLKEYYYIMGCKLILARNFNVSHMPKLSWQPERFGAKFRSTIKAGFNFTSDGVVVGAVIRNVEWYDLVKIKATESEAEHGFCLWLHRLRSSENCIVRVASRSGRINQCPMFDSGPTCSLRLAASSASASDSDHLVFTGS